MTDTELIVILASLPKLSREQWHTVDMAMLAVWRAKLEGTEIFPVRLG